MIWLVWLIIMFVNAIIITTVEMMYSLIDIEASINSVNERKGILNSLESCIRKTFYSNVVNTNVLSDFQWCCCNTLAYSNSYVLQKMGLYDI